MKRNQRWVDFFFLTILLPSCEKEEKQILFLTDFAHSFIHSFIFFHTSESICKLFSCCSFLNLLIFTFYICLWKIFFFFKCFFRKHNRIPTINCPFIATSDFKNGFYFSFFSFFCSSICLLYLQAEPVDESLVKKMILTFEKRSYKNQELRIKFPDSPEK